MPGLPREKEGKLRTINLSVDRSSSDVYLGFNIRGGAEFDLGIFISSVAEDSIADSAGFVVGDQIIDVNGKSFENITHEEAVEFINENSNLCLTVQSTGRIPAEQQSIGRRNWIANNGEKIIESANSHGSTDSGRGAVINTPAINPPYREQEVVGKHSEQNYPPRNTTSSNDFPSHVHYNMDTANTKTKHSSKNSTGKRSVSKSESKKQSKMSKKKNGSAKNKDQLQHTLVYERDNILNQITENLKTVFTADEQKVIKQYISMYHEGDNVDALMDNILLRFNTPRKFQMLKEVRKTIYSDEVQRYDERCVGHLRQKKAESIKRSHTVNAPTKQEKVNPPIRAYTYDKTLDVQKEPSFTPKPPITPEPYMAYDKEKQPVQTPAGDIQDTIGVDEADGETTRNGVELEEADGDINIEHDAIAKSKSEQVPAPVETNDVLEHVTCNNDVVVGGEGSVPQSIASSPLSLEHSAFDKATNTITINATIRLDGNMFRSHWSSMSPLKTPPEVCTVSESIVLELENDTLPVVDAAELVDDTALPVEATVEPVSVETTAEPVSVEATAEPVPVEATVEPVSVEAIVEPVFVEAIVEPVFVEATIEPVQTLPDEPVTPEVTRKKTPELIPVVQKTITYQVSKEHKFIGLSISGGADSRYQREIRVVSVNPNSASAIAGLEVGQVLISLDDHNLTSATHAEACQLIRSTFRNKRNKVMNVTVALDT